LGDLTGERTVALMRSLLGAHRKLFMSVKSDPAGTPATAPFMPGGGLKPGWLAMLRAFPDRFVVGSDQFYDSPPIRSERARKFVDFLPPDLARAIAYENVRHIYRPPAAHTDAASPSAGRDAHRGLPTPLAAVYAADSARKR
jgi:hypothetical protein